MLGSGLFGSVSLVLGGVGAWGLFGIGGLRASLALAGLALAGLALADLALAGLSLAGLAVAGLGFENVALN